MAEHPYTMNLGAIPKFLKHIRESGVPPKVTIKYLVSVGFGSSNDRNLIPVLKGIGFLDASNAPTDFWKRYRGADDGAVLAEAIRGGYPDLFATYPDAQLKDDLAVTNYIKGHTELAARTVGFVVKTFKTLCASADFTRDGVGATTPHDPKPPVTEREPAPLTPVRTVSGTSTQAAVVNINIALTLPPSADGKVYDAFFAAMKKHLLG